MTRQPALFDEFDTSRQARWSDPDTSHAARHGRVFRAEILAMFRWQGELTDAELCALFPAAHPPTIKSARSRLSKVGELFDTGYRRRSERGCPMVVWALSSEPQRAKPRPGVEYSQPVRPDERYL